MITLSSNPVLVAVLGGSWLAFWHFLIAALNEHGPFSKHWASSTWTCFFTTNRRARPPSRPVTYFALEEHDAAHLTASLVISSDKAAAAALLVYRAFAVAYVAFTVFAIATWGEGVHSDFLKFFTHWNLVLVAVYGALGVCVSWRTLQGFALRRGRRYGAEHASNGESALLTEPLEEQNPKASSPARVDYTTLDACFAGVLVTAMSCGSLLTAVFWLYIYPAQDHTVHKIDLANVLRHGVNVLVTLGDLLLSRTPVCGYWFHAVLSYATSYALFFGLLSALGIAPYTEVLDKGIFWIGLALPFVLVLAFAIAWGAAQVRETLFAPKPTEHSILPVLLASDGQQASTAALLELGAGTS